MNQTSRTQSPPTRTLVIAYIDDHPKSIIVLRTARKRAQEIGGSWCAIYVETPALASHADDGIHERMLRLLTLAAQMGGETIHLEAASVEEGLRKFLRVEKERLALCVVGSMEWQETRHKWWPGGGMSSWRSIASLAATYAPVEAVPLTGQPFVRGSWPKPHLSSVRLRHLAYALFAVGVAYGCAELLQWLLPPALFRVNGQNVTLLFMIACVFIAGRYGLAPGLLAAVTGSLSVNYYFLSPYHNIGFNHVGDMLNITLFLLAAVLIALLTSQARDYADQVAQREMNTQALFTLYRIAVTAFTRGQALEKLHHKLTHMLEMDVAFFLPPAMNPDRIELAYPSDLVLDGKDYSALEVCWREMKTTGLASPYNPDTRWRFEPMVATGGEIGVLGIRPLEKKKLNPWHGRLLTVIADQTAAVLEHIEMEHSMEATRVREEREKLRSMLLSSVSHDLKTPLSGIIGSLSVLKSMDLRLPANHRADLLETALEEAHRLDSFITNILDMTRLESNSIELHQEWQDMRDIVQQVEKRLHHSLRRHRLTVYPFPADVEVYMDAMMMGQVLQNLIDNACKYTAPDTRIEISSRIEERGFIMEIRDYGEGLPPDKLMLAFDKYARLQKKDSQVAGTGLGLAICKAMMEAQKGWITASNHLEGGAVFTLCLPQWRETVRQILEVEKETTLYMA